MEEQKQLRPHGDGLVAAGDSTPQLKSGRNRVERISEHGKGLVGDLTSWLELRLKLAQVEIEEKVDAKINQAVSMALVAGVALLGLVFLLIAFGMGASALLITLGLSHPLSYFLGFLLIALLLFATAGILQSMHPRFVDVGKKEAQVDREKLVSGVSPLE